MRGRRARLLPRGVGSLHMSGLGVVSPEPCTSVSAYLRYLLVCVRSERFSSLVEHALRTMHMPLEPGRRIPRLLLERGTASPWDWLAWRLLEPEGRRQRPVAEKHPVGAVQRRIELLSWAEAANLQANAYRERGESHVGARPSSLCGEVQRARATRVCWASRSCSGQGEIEVLAPSLVMFELVGYHPQRQRLHLGDRLLLRRPIGQHTGHLHDLGDPATVDLLLELDAESH